MRILITLLLIIYTSLLQAQQVSYLFEKQKILLGETLKVTAQTSLANGGVLPLLWLDSVPHFEVLERSKIDTLISGGLLRLSQTITLTSWDSGQWPLPSALIQNKPSKPVLINVAFTTPWNPTQPYHDIKAIVQVKRPEKQTWWWYLVGIAVLLALFGLFFPSGKKEKPLAPLDNQAYKKALLQLAALQKQSPTEQDTRPHYTELISIFRTYLKNGKGIQSHSKTTTDLGLQLQAAKMEPEAYNRLLQTLRLSDLVKFARYVPEATVTNEAFDTITQSITTIEQGYAV